MSPAERDTFLATLVDELRTAWLKLRGAHGAERFYSFGVYTTALAEYLMVTASTEEGLNAVVADYQQKYGGDPVRQRASLRWSPCDSPLHLEGEALLPLTSELREQLPDPYQDCPQSDAAIEAVFEIAVQALKRLDEEGLFGAGDERARLVLSVWKGDQSDEERVAFARLLNSASVADAFERELAAG